MFFNKWLVSRPEIARQQESTDCAYVCIEMALAMHGQRRSVPQIKAHVGGATRGVSVRQLQTMLGQVGVVGAALAFDPNKPKAYPCPGIVLLSHGHFVYLAAAHADYVDLFDPANGWQNISLKHFVPMLTGVGIEIRAVKCLVPQKIEPTWPFLRIAQRAALSKLGLRVLALSFLAQVLTLLVPLLTQATVDAVSPASGLSTVSSIAFAFLLITVLGSLCTIVSSFGSRLLAKRLTLNAASDMFNRLAARPAIWFESRPPGHALSLFQAMTNLQMFFSELIGRTLTIVVIFSAGVAAVFYISPWLVVPGLISMFIAAALDYTFQAANQRAGTRAMLAQIEQRSFFYDVVSQLPALRRVGSAWRARARFGRTVRRSADTGIEMMRLSATRSAIGTFVSHTDNLVFVCLAGYFMRAENLSIGVFVAAGLYKGLLAQALASLFQLRQQYAALAPQRLLLTELMSVVGIQPSPSPRVTHGQVVLSNIGFRYGALEPWVLRHVTLTVPSGMCLALCGPSGAGKSTLLKLICGVATPEEGNINIDNMLVEIGMQAMGVVLQTDRLISGSIRDNILYFRKTVADESIYSVLEVAGLADFVRALPLNLDTPVGDASTGLSSGQRQRILIARALLGEPRLLVLDEATSSLDVMSEASILARLRSTGITLIICTHRPEVWQFADKIYGVREGTLTEQSLYI